MLKVKIYSFSYKKSGIPSDDTINGGGFVFDCRYIYNPGREERFKAMTGKDKEVVDFLDAANGMRDFLESVFKIVDGAIENYLMRGFSDLMVSFGCTGGQHRSIYASEKLKQHITEKFGDKIEAVLSHREFPHLKN